MMNLELVKQTNFSVVRKYVLPNLKLKHFNIFLQVKSSSKKKSKRMAT